MTGISFSCPSCGAQVPVPDGRDPDSCPKCGYAIANSGVSSVPKAVRHCINCKQELHGGVTICPQCGTDQETGRRSFSYGKRHGDGAKSGDGRLDEKSPSFSSAVVLLILGIGIAVCVFFLALSSSPTTPLIPPAPLKAQPIRTDDAPSAPPFTNVVVRIPQVPAETPLAAALSRYETSLRLGRLDTAQQARLQIERRFGGGVPTSVFWEHTFSPTSCLSVTMYYLCTVCSDGTCPVCRNSPTCASCKGGGICSACGGVPTRRVPCPACVCQTCDGDGRCAACSGSGTVGCSACDAIGYNDQKNVIACPSCGGTGQRKGLRTGNGYMPIRCLTCNGTGRITQHLRQRCAVCGGQTRVRCAACSGGKLCMACRGIGRTPGCITCGGKGAVDAVCKTCDGNKKCPTCSGVGHCQRCQGSGTCYLSKKTGLIREAQFPAPSTWLARATGYVVFDTASQQVVLSSDRAGHHNVVWNERSLAFDVASNEVVWISTTPSFQQIASLFVPQ
jgi:hypothetical protein